MRTSLSITLLLLCLTALSLGGCPTSGKHDAVNTKPAQTAAKSGNAEAQPDSGGTPAEATGAPPAAQPEGLKLFGAYLGMSADDFMALFPKGGEYEAAIKWMSPGDVAIANVRPVGGGAESRDADFAGGILVHYGITEKLDDAKYRKVTDNLTALYGAPSDRPPDFAAGNDFFKSFDKDRTSFTKVMFWSDPANRTLISATQWLAKDQMYFLLFNPEAYDSLHKRQMKTPPIQQIPPPTK